MAVRVNTGSNYSYQKHFKLGNDIAYAGTENNYTAIGCHRTGTTYNPFKGSFDGDGHTVSGIRLNSSGEYQGLFGKVSNFGTVKNVTLAGSTITGSIVGHNTGGTVTGCRVLGDVYIYADASNAYWHGGIVGYNVGTVSGCYSAATVSSNGKSGCKHYGGIVGYDFAGTVTGNIAVGATVSGWSGNTGAIVGTKGSSGGTLAGNYYRDCNVGGYSWNVGVSDADVIADNGTVEAEEFATRPVAIGAQTATYTGGITLYQHGASYDGKYYLVRTAGNIPAVAGRWQAISFPKHDDNNENILGFYNCNHFQTGAYDLYRYNEATSTWENEKDKENNSFFNLEPARGYLYRRSTDDTIDLYGLFNNADSYSIDLTADGSGDLQGFNLVGNPYPFRVLLAWPFYSLGGDGSWTAHPSGDSLDVGQGALVHTATGETLTFYRDTRSTNSVAKGSLPPLPKGLCLGGDCDQNTQDAHSAHFAHVTGDQLIIQGEGTLTAYDIMGRELFRCEASSDLRLPTSAFPQAGVYILRMGVNSQKIVIK